LKLSLDDRRWLVPKVTEEKANPGFWKELNDWLTKQGGLGIITWWAKEFLRDKLEVKAGENAPDSAAKRAMIFDNLSPGLTLVSIRLEEMRERAAQTGAAVFTTDQLLILLIQKEIYGDRRPDHLEKPATIRKLAKSLGWFIGEHQTTKWEPRTGKSRMIATTRELADRRPEDLDREGKTPLDPKDVGPM
jgi:hypothetical protein